MLSNGEIVPIRPVPEPATVFMAAALAGAAALRERRRLAGLWGGMAYSALDTTRLRDEYALELPDWRDALARTLA